VLKLRWKLHTQYFKGQERQDANNSLCVSAGWTRKHIQFFARADGPPRQQ